MDIEEGGEGKGKEGGEGIQRALGALEFLTQDADLSRTMLIDVCNGFNKLIHLVMLWTMQHRCQAGARFVFNLYRHWAQLLLRQLGEPPVTIMI